MTKFEKIRFESYLASFGMTETATEDYQMVFIDNCRREHEALKLPRRATMISAGYDFFAPYGFELEPGCSLVIHTGIKVNLLPNQVLFMLPRSGLGFKYFVGLANTVGVIDADYIFSDNEGHIMLKLVNNGSAKLEIEAGQAIAQGIILRYDVTDDDEAHGIRNGGFGSTDIK